MLCVHNEAPGTMILEIKRILPFRATPNRNVSGRIRGGARWRGTALDSYLRAPPTSEIERAAAVTSGANRSSVSSGV